MTPQRSNGEVLKNIVVHPRSRYSGVNGVSGKAQRLPLFPDFDHCNFSRNLGTTAIVTTPFTER